jgi:hypothetical protein
MTTFVITKRCNDDSNPWYIATWPDGTWCNWEDRHEYLSFMSDDYVKERVISYDEGYCPVETEEVSK